MSLSEIVSSMGLTFFPIAALLLFLAVFTTVVVRMFLVYDKDRSSLLAHAPLDDGESDSGETHKAGDA